MRPALLPLLAFAAVLVAPLASHAEKEKPVRPPTKQTQAIRPETFKIMEQAQKDYEAKDYNGALKVLDGIRAKADTLNDYERATLHNLYAAVYFAKDDIKGAIGAYHNVLKQPNLPDGLRNQSHYALAQLYFISEDYPRAEQMLKTWFELIPEPSPDGHVLLAQMQYQRQDYKAAEKSLLTALRIARGNQQEFKENWLALLRAVYYELKEYDKSAKVLELLVSGWPAKGTYWQQLAGLYGLLDRQADQARVMHAAYRAGHLTKESDLLNLARLYMVSDAPWPAAKLLEQGFGTKAIKASAETLQLYAQALVLAREYEKQLPVLEKLAEMTNESKHYVFLGQAYSEMAKWKEASDAFRGALKGKNVSDAGALRLQLGTALFNAGRLSDAREAFEAAARSEKHETAATNWIRFVNSEIRRKRALAEMS